MPMPPALGPHCANHRAGVLSEVSSRVYHMLLMIFINFQLGLEHEAALFIETSAVEELPAEPTS